MRSVRLGGIGVVALPFSEEGDDARGAAALAPPVVLVPEQDLAGTQRRQGVIRIPVLWAPASAIAGRIVEPARARTRERAAS